MLPPNLTARGNATKLPANITTQFAPGEPQSDWRVAATIIAFIAAVIFCVACSYFRKPVQETCCPEEKSDNDSPYGTSVEVTPNHSSINR